MSRPGNMPSSLNSERPQPTAVSAVWKDLARRSALHGVPNVATARGKIMLNSWNCRGFA